MRITPEYGNNIIVGVNYHNSFSWYVTDKDYWILDLEKRKADFIKNGFEYDAGDILATRFNIEIVNEKSAGDYLPFLEPFKVAAPELKGFILNQQYEDTILSLSPSLYIDFDQKKLYSAYPEGLPFERYVPDGWSGQYETFTNHIPEGERYWMVDGVDLIQKMYNEEIKRFFGDSAE